MKVVYSRKSVTKVKVMIINSKVCLHALYFKLEQLVASGGGVSFK